MEIGWAYTRRLAQRREKQLKMLDLELKEEKGQCEKRLKKWDLEKLIKFGHTMPDLEPSFAGACLFCSGHFCRGWVRAKVRARARSPQP